MIDIAESHKLFFSLLFLCVQTITQTTVSAAAYLKTFTSYQIKQLA